MGIRRLAPTVLLAAAVLAGCSSSEAGAPVAADDPASGPPPTTTPRPRPLCPLRTGRGRSTSPASTSARSSQGTTGSTATDRRSAATRRCSPARRDCFAGGVTANLSLLVVAVTDRSARSFVDSANVVGATEADAAGYRVTVLTPADPATCLGVLDVHDEQLVHLSYGLGSPNARPVTSQADLCRSIPTIAAATIGALG